MSNSPPPHPIAHIDHAMSGLNLKGLKGEPVSESEFKEGVTPTFDTLMEELACKVQGDKQSVRQFAAQVEAAVYNIYHSYPELMSESCMVQVRRTQFFHGLKRVYKDSFRHLYEDEEASFERLLQRASAVEESLDKLRRLARTEEAERPASSNNNNSHKKIKDVGWTRTGLEPEVVVHVNNQPLDAILDTGSNISIIDRKIVDSLKLKVTPFTYGVPQVVGFEGPTLVSAMINIIGWVEIELGVLGIGCLTTRLWVTNSLYNKGVPIVLGSYQIKQILAQANVKRIDCWQQPWKFIYEGSAQGKWYAGKCDEVLSDSEDSFEILPQNQCKCPDRMLKEFNVPDPPGEEQVKQVEELIEKSGSTALKGIPGPLDVPDEKEDSTPAAQVVYPLPRIAEVYNPLDGDDLSVFASLTEGSAGLAAEDQPSPCNKELAASTAPSAVELPPHPTVSCRITPTGEASFSLQWGNK